MDPLGVHAMASVAATPVAVSVTTEAQAPELIELVPRAIAPLAIVTVYAVQFCAVPEALMPVGACPAEHPEGDAARAVAVAALPVVELAIAVALGGSIVQA